MLLPPPNSFGLPDKYSEWRLHQDEAILAAVDSTKRFVAQVAPTGFGKSLSYVLMAMLQGGRGLFLTSTKGLQTQLMNDFQSIGLEDIRGRNAYPCIAEVDGTTCDRGPCIAGIECSSRDSCKYHYQVTKARNANLVVTNYSYWLHANEFSEGLGDFDFMVCDEAHDVPDIMSSYLTVSIERDDPILHSVLPPESTIHTMDIDAWCTWAGNNIEVVNTEIEYLKKTVKNNNNKNTRRQLSRALAAKRKLKYMVTMHPDTWIQDINKYSATFAPIWPAPYCENTLFNGVGKILLTSASIRPKTAHMLGITDSWMDFMEYPHSFPVASRMLYHVPTVRMNFRTTDGEMREWQTRIDQIIKGRLDRKGMVHTVSYKRRNLIITKSKYADIMITHDQKGAEIAVRRFKSSQPPSVLISPSMSTGWDFPGDFCRFQIIGKLAYPDTTSKIVKARSKDDKDYAAYIAMQQLVQACGRGVRAIDDFCENIIIDDNITWFMRRHGGFAPDWFREAYRPVNSIPSPPKLSD